MLDRKICESITIIMQIQKAYPVLMQSCLELINSICEEGTFHNGQLHNVRKEN